MTKAIGGAGLAKSGAGGGKALRRVVVWMAAALWLATAGAHAQQPLAKAETAAAEEADGGEEAFKRAMERWLALEERSLEVASRREALRKDCSDAMAAVVDEADGVAAVRKALGESTATAFGRTGPAIGLFKIEPAGGGWEGLPNPHPNSAPRPVQGQALATAKLGDAYKASFFGSGKRLRGWIGAESASEEQVAAEKQLSREVLERALGPAWRVEPADEAGAQWVLARLAPLRSVAEAEALWGRIGGWTRARAKDWRELDAQLASIQPQAEAARREMARIRPLTWEARVEARAPEAAKGLGYRRVDGYWEPAYHCLRSQEEAMNAVLLSY